MIIERNGNYEVQTNLGKGEPQVFKNVTLLVEGSWLLIMGGNPVKLIALVPSESVRQVVPVEVKE